MSASGTIEQFCTELRSFRRTKSCESTKPGNIPGTCTQIPHIYNL